MSDHIEKIYKIVSRIDKEVCGMKITQELNHKENKKDIFRLYRWLWAITILFVGASLTVTISSMAG